jgi:hypothetical protein
LVADGGSGEVLRLGGYTGVRPEPKAEEKRWCGAHRGGKRRWHFDALDQCTDLAERGRKVPTSLGAERGCRTKERGGGH